MEIYGTATVLAALFNIGIGIYIFTKDPTSQVTRRFLAATGILAFWGVAEALTLLAPTDEIALLSARISYVPFFILPLFLCHLVYHISQGKWRSLRRAARIIPFVLVIPFFTNVFIEGVSYTEFGYNPVYGDLLPYFAVIFLFFIVSSFLFLWSERLKLRLGKIHQIDVMLSGFFISIIFVTFFEFLSPLIGLDLPKIGSIFTVFATIASVHAYFQYSTLIYPELRKQVSTKDALCGALCSLCSSFHSGRCKSCSMEDEEKKTRCKVYMCALEKGVNCLKCTYVFTCELYREYREHCPCFDPFRYLPSGNSYRVESADYALGRCIFREQLIRGDFGLVVSREHPDIFFREWDLERVPLIWLSVTDENKWTINPENLAKLTHIINNFIGRFPISCILFEGFEYLVIHNSFSTTMKAILSIDDEVVRCKSRFILSYDPRTLDKDMLAVVERELKSLPEEYSIAV
ncbi:MAG: DUF835 domain-containing protein [Theionarchaea archaeon]|nr:DUF835 domain-containing protein [Theionarchaea archaeon]